MAFIQQYLAVACVVGLASGGSEAQVLDRPGLTLDGARQAIAAAVGEAKRLRAPGGVIPVVRYP